MAAGSDAFIAARRVFALQPSRDVDMCTLTECVDPRISPASAMDRTFSPAIWASAGFQMILNRVPAGLTLPACEGRAVVGHD
jgi:hypothetical protein